MEMPTHRGHEDTSSLQPAPPRGRDLARAHVPSQTGPQSEPGGRPSVRRGQRGLRGDLSPGTVLTPLSPQEAAVKGAQKAALHCPRSGALCVRHCHTKQLSPAAPQGLEV